MEVITLGSGCFWCTETIFSKLQGVSSAISGYAGGEKENPSYDEVCSGGTGHAEVVQITFDEQVISLEEILEVFWKMHDPTTLNRQGNDVGSQYRSVIFYHNDIQKDKASLLMKDLDESGAWVDPIVTEIIPFEKFYPAEDYHQGYFDEHGSQPYCQFVIAPKVKKFKEVFQNKVK